MKKRFFLTPAPSISVRSWLRTRSPATSTGTGSSCSTNGIKFIKEEHAGRCSSCLVKDFTNIGLRLTKPHGKKLRAFYGNEVRRALVGYCFCEESLTTTRWAIEENTLGWLHTKLSEFIRMLDRVKNHLSETGFDIFKTTNIFPSCGWDLDSCFSERRRV